MSNEEFSLHPNHFTMNCFKQTVTLKQLRGIINTNGSSVFRNGEFAEIKWKRICPGCYEVWLENSE